MIEKGFLRILKGFNNDRDKYRTKPYNFYLHCDDEEKQLHQLYFQYKILKMNKWLVFATWALAIVTILVLVFN